MTADPYSTRWGPFTAAISHAELVSRLRVLRAICQRHFTDDHPVMRALYFAESGEPAEVEAARIEFDRLPALTGRHILGSYARHWKYAAKREPKPQPALGSGEPDRKEAADADA
jgi:hypothetical protein